MRRAWLIPAVLAMVVGACSGAERGAGDADQGGERQTGQGERTPTGGAHDSLMDSRAGAGAAAADGGAAGRALGAMYAADNLEVQTAQLALQHAQAPAVKRLATRIAQEHQAHLQKVEATSKQARTEATPPANAVTEQMQAQDRLAGKTGADFDREFVALQIDAHRKNIDALKQMQSTVQNADVKALIDTTLPTLQAHLDAAEAAQRSLGN